MPMRIGVYGRMPFLGGLVSSEEDSFVPSAEVTFRPSGIPERVSVRGWSADAIGWATAFTIVAGGIWLFGSSEG